MRWQPHQLLRCSIRTEQGQRHKPQQLFQDFESKSLKKWKKNNKRRKCEINVCTAQAMCSPPLNFVSKKKNTESCCVLIDWSVSSWLVHRVPNIILNRWNIFVELEVSMSFWVVHSFDVSALITLELAQVYCERWPKKELNILGAFDELLSHQIYNTHLFSD